MSEMAEKVAIVTGAAQGIGKAIALELARAGVDLVLGDVQLDGAKAVAGEIIELGRKAVPIHLDVSSQDSTTAMAKATIEEFGRIDYLINNAGITRDNLLMRMKPEEWSSVISVNLTGVFNCTQAVVRYMMKARFGRIVNIASVIGQAGNPGQANYGATKAGVIGFTKSAARELGSRNITVNAIAPGFIVSAMTDNLPENVRQQMLDTIPLGRLGEPDDIARAVRYLVSDDASYVTGSVLNVNGGMYM